MRYLVIGNDSVAANQLISDLLVSSKLIKNLVKVGHAVIQLVPKPGEPIIEANGKAERIPMARFNDLWLSETIRHLKLEVNETQADFGLSFIDIHTIMGFGADCIICFVDDRSSSQYLQNALAMADKISCRQFHLISTGNGGLQAEDQVITWSKKRDVVSDKAAKDYVPKQRCFTISRVRDFTLTEPANILSWTANMLWLIAEKPCENMTLNVMLHDDDALKEYLGRNFFRPVMAMEQK